MFIKMDSSERIESVYSTLTLTKTLKRIKQYQIAYAEYTGYSHAIEYRLLSVCEIEQLSTEVMYGAGITDVEDMAQTREGFL
jgi:hypothetical protein